MITEWRYAAQIIVSSKEQGESLYSALRAFPNDPLPDEGVFNTALNNGAFATEMLVKQSLIDIADDFNTGGYPQVLLDAGKTEAEIDALRDQVFITYYNLLESGNRVVDSTALDDFIAAKGYTRITQ